MMDLLSKILDSFLPGRPTFQDKAKLSDELTYKAGFNRELTSVNRYTGHIKAVLTGADGQVKGVYETHNLVTDIGDQYFSSLSRVGGAASATNAFKLGSASTAVAKNSAGAFVATGDYISGSAKACDASSPKVGASANITQWLRTYAAGEGTGTIRRVGMVNNTTDAGEASAANTWAMGLFTADIPKGASDTLAITWTVTSLGA